MDFVSDFRSSFRMLGRRTVVLDGLGLKRKKSRSQHPSIKHRCRSDRSIVRRPATRILNLNAPQLCALGATLKRTSSPPKQFALLEETTRVTAGSPLYRVIALPLHLLEAADY